MALDYNDIEDFKFNPFTNTYTYTSIVDESHVVPAAPVLGSYMVKLYHAPRETIPTSTSITIGGNPLTEVASSPGNMEYRVYYDEKGRGWVEFNSSQAGDTALISYSSYGTLMTTATLQAIYNAFFMRPLIYGLSMTNSPGDLNNDIDFGVGWAFNMAESQRVALSAMTKRLDATFTAGTGNGMLDTGVKAVSTDYYIYLIGKNSDLSAGDILASTNATTPALPATWTNYTLIGIIQTDAGGDIRQGQWTRINENLKFRLKDFLVLRAHGGAGSSARILITAIAPLNSYILMRMTLVNVAAYYVNYGETFETDNAPSTPDNSRIVTNNPESNDVTTYLKIDGSKQIFVRANNNGCNFGVYEDGWEIAL